MEEWIGSLGESISGVHVYRRAEQICEEESESVDALAYKLENGMRKLIESIQYKREQGDWEDSFILKGSNIAYRSPEQDNAP